MNHLGQTFDVLTEVREAGRSQGWAQWRKVRWADWRCWQRTSSSTWRTLKPSFYQWQFIWWIHTTNESRDFWHTIVILIFSHVSIEWTFSLKVRVWTTDWNEICEKHPIQYLFHWPMQHLVLHFVDREDFCFATNLMFSQIAKRWG